MQASYQIHALVGLDAIALVNLADGSALLAPGLSWAATGSTSVRLGIYSGLGQAGLEALGTLSVRVRIGPGGSRTWRSLAFFEPFPARTA